MSRSGLAIERKLQIIKATIECISHYGYNNFSMQDVARFAEVSKGIIHYYFLNKEDLMMAVLNHVGGEIEDLLSTSELTHDPAIHLSNVIQICITVVQTKREYYRINMDFWSQIDQKEKVRQEVAKHYSKFRTSIAEIIQQGMDLDLFIKGDASQLASIIIAIIDGIALQFLFDESLFYYDDIVKTCKEVIMKFLLIA